MSTMARRRKDSDEIDVFEAARYFSGGTDSNVSVRSAVGGHGIRMREVERFAWRPLRKSLDMPIGTMISQPPPKVDKQCINEKKNSKQPSSPGGRLASFLNSLFNQVASKVKVKSKSSSLSTKDNYEENYGGRSRRSSISHSPSLTASTSTKVYKVINDETKRLAPKVVMEKKETLKNYGEDDDGESDSSSDLFELKNYELSDHHVSSGLPVYGATNMKVIKRDVTIVS
ncbi:putative protein BIG GRAIN 1 [Dioscorea sansibarensis]